MDHKTEKPQNQNSSGRFFDGLLVGLILGFGLALLITTKKGRKMLKALTEEGMDSVSELKRRLDKIEVDLDEEGPDTDEEYIEEEIAEEAENKANGLSGNKESVDPIEKKTSKKKLFKGISRKN